MESTRRAQEREMRRQKGADGHRHQTRQRTRRTTVVIRRLHEMRNRIIEIMYATCCLIKTYGDTSCREKLAGHACIKQPTRLPNVPGVGNLTVVAGSFTIRDSLLTSPAAPRMRRLTLRRRHMDHRFASVSLCLLLFRRPQPWLFPNDDRATRGPGSGVRTTPSSPSSFRTAPSAARPCLSMSFARTAATTWAA